MIMMRIMQPKKTGCESGFCSNYKTKTVSLYTMQTLHRRIIFVKKHLCKQFILSHYFLTNRTSRVVTMIDLYLATEALNHVTHSY